MVFVKRLLRDQRGQTTTEYMVIIGVIVAALLAAAYLFIPEFKSGVQDLGKNVKGTLGEGFKGGGN